MDRQLDAGHTGGLDKAHLLAGLQRDAALANLPHADLGAWQISQDADGSAEVFGNSPDELQHRAKLFEIAVGEIDAKNADPDSDEFRHRRFVGGGGSEGGDDFGQAVAIRGEVHQERWERVCRCGAVRCGASISDMG